MNIILDVNIVLSALIKDSMTRRIITESDQNFYFPEHSLKKINKYKDYVIEKSLLTETEYTKILEKLFKYIKLIPTESLENNWYEATKIMEHIDPEDVIFIACELLIENSIIWSDDGDFDEQNKMRILKSKEIAKMFLDSLD